MTRTLCGSARRLRTLVLVVLVVLVAVGLVDGSSGGTPATDDTARPTIGEGVRPLTTFNSYDYLAVLCLAAGLALAAVGGVGGGPIIVPILVLIMGIDIKYATPMSNFMIMGGAVANALFNLRKRHPHADRPLLDADICLAMIPAMIGGAVVGAFFSKLLPNYVIKILFVAILLAAGVRTMQRGFQRRRLEKIKEGSADTEAPPRNREPATPPVTSTEFCEMQSPSSAMTRLDGRAVVIQDPEQELSALLDKESRISWSKHLIVLLCYLGIVAASVGGAQTRCGSALYWILLWGELPWVLTFTVLFILYMRRNQAYKRALGYPSVPGDLVWSVRTVMLFPLGCVLAGLLAGLFGIGGGVITGPLMIEMGVLPEVASATTALLVLYSSAAATTKFAFFHVIAWDWSAMFCGIAFIVTIIAQVLITGIVRRTGRQSIIVFCIGATIIIGALLMLYSVITTTAREARKPFRVEFCPTNH